MHKVSLAAEKLFTLFNWLPVTNTLFTAWVVMFLLFLLTFLATRKIKAIPTSRFQNFIEMVIEGILGIIESVTGNAKNAREFFGVIATIFLFVLFSNWFGLIPGVGSVGFFEKVANEEIANKKVEYEIPADKKIASEKTEKEIKSGTEHKVEFTPLLRAASSDLSFTLALAFIAVLYTQIIGFRHLGWKYLNKFFNFKNPINFFVGILEIISEFAKMVSFSFRLFGNVFAGEVLLVVMTFLVPYLVPIPFYGLEIFVGLVQAVVFATLTLVFLKGATEHH